MPNIHPSENSYLIDQESAAEMARLLEMDHMLNKHMTGLFPEDIELSNVHDILDIACGPGGWVQEVAFAYPKKRVVGIDISQNMLSYARAQAAIQGLKNASFLFMDATSLLQFPDDSFDIVNARFLGGFMWKEVWPKVVAECVRVTRPGGTIRLTETDSAIGITNSVALENMNRMLIKAGHRTGRNFSPAEDSCHGALTPMLRYFLKQGGCQLIRQVPYVIDYSADSPDHAAPSKNLRLAMKLVQPFLLKLGITTSTELENTYQQVVEELESDVFRGIIYFMSVYGQKPR